MAEATPFAQFIHRIRAGDEQAAAELVREYEPLIRREVRLRLHDPNLRRALDSVDVCQSVLRSFFVRAAVGQFDLDGPEDLVNLLLRMARNKLIDQVRRRRRRAEVDGTTADLQTIGDKQLRG